MKAKEIVRKIGGKDVKDAAGLQALYDEALKNLDAVTQVGVDVLRKGKNVHLILNYRQDLDKED